MPLYLTQFAYTPEPWLREAGLGPGMRVLDAG